MKIKDLIEQLQTLDPEQELVRVEEDPMDWEYSTVGADLSNQPETVQSKSISVTRMSSDILIVSIDI
jgi:hypothetical protein